MQPIHLAHQVEHALSGSRVEVPGRLVGEQQRGAHRQRACDRHALLLAAGHLRGQAVSPGREAHAVEQLVGAPVHRSVRPASVHEHRHHDVLQRGEGGKQVVVLEHEAYAAAAQESERVVVESGRVRAANEEPPAARAIEQSHDVEQRALARARWTHQAQNSPRSSARSIPCSTSTSVGVPTLYALRMPSSVRTGSATDRHDGIEAGSTQRRCKRREEAGQRRERGRRHEQAGIELDRDKGCAVGVRGIDAPEQDGRRAQ